MPDFATDGPIVVDFVESFLTLGGSFMGQQFKVMPWMKDVLNDAYRLNEDGSRQRRTYVLGVPRKNAKSTLGAAIALYQLIADGADAGPQVISAAGDRAQAKLVFNEAKRMIFDSPELRSLCSVFRDEIRSNNNDGIYRVVSADAQLAHGLNPSTVIVDEYHGFKNTRLFDALTSGSAMRQEPLTFVISTAGYDLQGPFGQLYEYGRRVESGEQDDPSFGFTWFGPAQGEEFDPGDPAVWEKFNPAMSLMNEKEFESAYRQMPESEFIRFRLNGWTATQEGWFKSGVFESRLNVDDPLRAGDEVVLGFDGAWKRDSTAVVAVRLEDFHIEPVGVWEAPINDPQWVTPHHEVLDTIRAAASQYNVREIIADPSRWEFNLQELEDEGLPVTSLPNSAPTMIAATQAFYDGVLNGTLSHNGDQTLLRHVANATLKMDERGARLTKVNKSSLKHIDVAVAAVMAHYRARQFREQREPQILVFD